MSNTEPKKTGESRRARDRAEIESDDRLLDIHQVSAFVQLGETTIRKMIAEGDFPRPLCVPPKAAKPQHRWTLRALKDWIKRLQITAA